MIGPQWAATAYFLFARQPSLTNLINPITSAPITIAAITIIYDTPRRVPTAHVRLPAVRILLPRSCAVWCNVFVRTIFKIDYNIIFYKLPSVLRRWSVGFDVTWRLQSAAWRESFERKSPPRFRLLSLWMGRKKIDIFARSVPQTRAVNYVNFEFKCLLSLTYSGFSIIVSLMFGTLRLVCIINKIHILLECAAVCCPEEQFYRTWKMVKGNGFLVCTLPSSKAEGRQIREVKIIFRNNSFLRNDENQKPWKSEFFVRKNNTRN